MTLAPFFVRLALFGGLTLATGALIEAAISAATHDHIAAKYEALYHGPDAFNALILGSSVEAHGIDPAALDGHGLRWYNDAFNGAGPLFLADWYDLYRATGRRPRVVLLAADWFELSSNFGRQIEQDGRYLPWPVFFHVAALPHHSPGLLLANALALPSTREQTQAGLALVALPKVYRLLPAAFHDGYVPLAGGAPHLDAPAGQTEDWLPGAAEAYQRLLGRLKAEGVRVVLVRPPELEPSAGQHAARALRMLRLGGATNLPLLDYTGAKGAAIANDPTLFVDWCHLNQQGSQRFSRLLGQDLGALLGGASPAPPGRPAAPGRWP